MSDVLTCWSDASSCARCTTMAQSLLAAGNSNGDLPMLDFTRHQDKPSLSLLLVHDDADREFDYTAGAEQALERAEATGWT